MARPQMPKEKLEAIKKLILSGCTYKEIIVQLEVSNKTLYEIRQKMIDAGELVIEERDISNKRLTYIPSCLWSDFDVLRLPIKKYYERLRNGQGTEKSTREIKQIRLVPRED